MSLLQAHRASPARLSPLGVLALLLLSGCQERCEESWPESRQRRFHGRATKVDGERRATGHWTFWYPDGETKQAQGWFDAGGLPGLETVDSGGTRVPLEGRTKRWFFWDEGGRILSEGVFESGRRDDLWACWKEDGELCCTGYFEQGVPSGFHSSWIDGDRRDEHYYAEGLLDGPRTVRDASGATVWTGEYSAGKLVSAGPSGQPEPALHLLERCAQMAEEGRRTTPEDHLEAASGG